MSNPLLETWDTPFGLPPFDRIEAAHFMPAFEAALAEDLAEIEAIATDPATPDFANTIGALERCSRVLDRVAAVFFNLAGSHTNPALQAVEREISPKLAAHHARVMLDGRLWSRVKAVIAGPGAPDPEAARVLELYRRSFVKAGADLDAAGKTRMAAIQTRLAELCTEFSQNVLKDESDWSMELPEAVLPRLPAGIVATAAEEGRARGRPGAHLVTLSRSSIEPFLQACPDRGLREIAWRAWTARGETVNWPLIDEILTLRREKAQLLGYPCFAGLKLEGEMAKTPDRVRDLLGRVWQAAKARVADEEAALARLAAGDGLNGPLAAWDWRYYAEKERRRLHDLDEGETRPYLALDRVIEAAFDVANRLFGVEFRVVEGLALHHPDARAWEMTRDGRHLALFVGDYFARPSKRSGAWMSGLRGQQKLWEPGRPIILNTMNFARAEPCLLSFDDAGTLFHEFGHALHGMLSDVTYPRIAGTSVARDFVELPSQLYEHWLALPEVLAAHARHVETGEAMPMDLIERIRGAETFNQGHKTVEFLGSALVDMAMHEIGGDAPIDSREIEAGVLAGIGMPAAVGMRHRSPHFQHVFAGDGYSAGYYSYMWAEVMDADAFRAFEDAGDPFDPALARRLLEHVYAAGGREEPEVAYTAFRGRMPGPEALLEGRGLVAAGEG